MTIASLIVNIEANTASLVKEVEKTNSSLDSVTKMATKIGSALGIAFSAQAVIGFAKEIFAFAGRMQDLAAQTGIGVERLQAWNYVLTGAGLQVEDMTRATEQLSKRLLTGDSSAVAAVERLGLKVWELKAMGPDQAFVAISTAIAGITDPMERTRTAMELFGKSGAQMLRVMTTDMKEVVDAAEKSGAVIQQELIDKAAKFGDAWEQAILRVKAAIVNLASVAATVVTATPGVGAFGEGKVGGGGATVAEEVAARNAKLAKDLSTSTKAALELATKAAGKFGDQKLRLVELTEQEITALRRQETQILSRNIPAEEKARKVKEAWTESIAKANAGMTFTLARLIPLPPAVNNMNVSTGAALPVLESFNTLVTQASLDLEDVANWMYRLPGAVKNADDSLKAFSGTIQASDTWSDAFSRLVGAGGNGAIGTQFADNFKQSVVQGLSSLPALLEHAFDGTAVGDQLGKDIGAAIGAVVGGFFGPLGSAAGASAGRGIAEAFRSDGEDVVRRIGNDWGLYITEEMGDVIARDAHNLFPEADRALKASDIFGPAENPLAFLAGREANLAAGEIFHLGDIIREFGVDAENAATFTTKLRDTFVFLAAGVFSASQATLVLDESFGTLADHAVENGGLVSKELLEIIRLTDQAGLSSKALNDFVSGQVSGAVGGILAMVTPAAAAMKTLGDQQKILDGLNTDAGKLSTGGSAAEKEAVAKAIAKITAEMATQQQILSATAITSQAAADGLTGALFGAFSELTARGMSAADAIKEMTPAIDGLQVQLLAAGLDGGAAFAQIQSMAALAANEVAGPALASIHGAATALGSLHNAGILNQTMFAGLAGQAATTFNTIVAQGHDSAAAMALIAPDLQRIWQLQQDFGYVVDDSTQFLIDQATEAGLVGAAHQSAQDKAVVAMERAAIAMERVGTVLETVFGTAGTESETFAARATAAIDSIPRDIEVRVRGVYIAPSGTGSFTTAASDGGHATGTHGRYVDFGRGTATVLHGRERVMTEREGRAEAAGGGAMLSELRGISRALRDQRSLLSKSLRDALQRA